MHRFVHVQTDRGTDEIKQLDRIHRQPHFVGGPTHGFER